MSELERYLEDLVRRRRPRRFRATQDDVPVIAAAIDLSAGRPGDDLPSAEFVARLHARLALEFGADAQGPPNAPAALRDATGGRAPRTASGRRQFLQRTGIAAACAACAAAGAAITRQLDGGPTPPATSLQPNVGTWQTVTTADAVQEDAPHVFEISGLRGFVQRREGRLVALSAVCTHQGCLLVADTATSELQCPCHRTVFDLDGHVVRSHLPRRPAALPRIPVREQDGQVQVLAPVSPPLGTS